MPVSAGSAGTPSSVLASADGTPMHGLVDIPGVHPFVMDFEFDTAAVASVTTDGEIPAGSIVNGVYVITEDGLTFATGTHLVVGTAADPDRFGEIIGTSMDAAGDVWKNTAIMAAPVAVDTAVAVQIGPSDGAGSGSSVLAGTVAGKAYVRVCGLTYDDIILPS